MLQEEYWCNECDGPIGNTDKCPFCSSKAVTLAEKEEQERRKAADQMEKGSKPML